MIAIPVSSPDPAVRALRSLEHDDFTGLTTSVVTLTQNPQAAYLLVWKNGLYLHNIAGADWTLAGNVLTLAVPLGPSDKLTAWYWTRAT